jgi:DNA-binding response OmpR family regulator
MPNARRLLVVDDDQDLRDTLTEQLALYDEFEILSADTAASAVNQAKGDRIDLAIIDVGLPDMDGREAECSVSRVASL